MGIYWHSKVDPVAHSRLLFISGTRKVGFANKMVIYHTVEVRSQRLGEAYKNETLTCFS